MNSPTTRRWRALIVAAMLGLPLVMGAMSTGSAATQAHAATLRPTPLILKDGRIANVSVHVLPFRENDHALATRSAEALDGLISSHATDCFLTAQVIGHVGAGEVEEGDALRAHRLARSRADTVQASLIAGGLPAKSIASVWDWQFLVRIPQATLWLFRLAEGEDCEGTPLGGARAVVASTTPKADERGDAGASGAALEPPGTQVVPARSPARSATGPSEPAPAAEPSGGATRVAARPSVDRKPSPPRNEKATSDRQASTEGSTLITFATNSSYFPTAARAQLEKLVATMVPGERYQIRLEAAVSGSSRVVGAKSPEEAEKYNRWLAERRAERIESWLTRHAVDHDFLIETSFKDDDASRAVRIDLVESG